MKRFMFALLCVALLCFSCAAFAQDDSQLPDPSTLPTFDLSQTNQAQSDGNVGDSIAAGIVATAKNASATGVGIPLWSYQVSSPVDGNTYTGVMVGRSPLVRGTRTTTVPVVIIPVVIEAQQGFVMNPTSADPGCTQNIAATPLSLTQQSPIFNNVGWTFGPTFMGNTQYPDATQRANFWQAMAANGGQNAYHTLLGTPTVAPTQVVIAPGATPGSAIPFDFNNPNPQPNASQIVAFGFGNCGTITSGATNRRGVMNVMSFQFFDPIAEQILANVHVPATSFALFLFYDTVMSNGFPLIIPKATPQNPNPGPQLGSCCILGYHSDNDDTSPNLITTYGVVDFDRGVTFTDGNGNVVVKDTSVMAHEVQEWMDDPLGNNLTPAWGHIGQQSGCQNNLEEGDPLSGTLYPGVPMPNGFTYHLQDVGPYFSWFFRTPPIGVNGWYDNIHHLTTDAGPVCH